MAHVDGPTFTRTAICRTVDGAMNAAVRKERLEARITSSQKRLLQRAAKLQGRSLTEFVVSSAQEAAARVLQERDVIRLSTRDREAFVSSLLKPPALSGRLANALDRYRHLFGK
jgi:uncharacterized protein (DUF1778 family)